MKKRLERLFALASALSFVCAPTIVLMVGLWMIYNVGLWIGLTLSIVGYLASLWEYFQLQTYFKDWKKRHQKKTK